MKYKVGDRVKYGSEICTVTKVLESQGKFKYRVQSDTWFDVVEDKMIEGLVEEETTNVKEENKMLIGWIKEPNRYRLVTDKDYEIKQDGDNFYLVKKKKEYPKTFLGCCDVLGIEDTIIRGVKGYKAELFDTLQKLYICRDAYWKIAGEEMELGKSWVPDWKNSEERKYCIVNTEGNITKWVQKTTNKILAFPTEEMRDAFYENFKELIEICKELL